MATNDNNTPRATKQNLLVSKAYNYYLKGLNTKETAVLLNISARTVQRYIKENGFEQKANPKPLPQIAYDLYKKGLNYQQIAKAIGKKKTTVYYYLKEMRSEQKND